METDCQQQLKLTESNNNQHWLSTTIIENVFDPAKKLSTVIIQNGL